LTPEEDQVTTALRIIDPQIERIALVGDLRVWRRFFVRLSGSEQRLPLGSVGDGSKRLLALALHLVSARGGYLLVDEIDTGLHHTVMADMWRLVIETAKRLDIQVLATTHSLDCVRALAWVQEQNPDLASEVTLHRVEKGATETVAYSMEELVVKKRTTARALSTLGSPGRKTRAFRSAPL
jgi:predicted ATPase